MKALCVLYGGRLESEAFEKVLPDGSGQESAFSLALAAGSRFPGVEKIVFFGLEGKDYPLRPDIETVLKSSWTRKTLLEELSRVSAGFDFTYFAWADCPLLDSALASALAERHKRYGAEYSYADGWPYGFAPEILSGGTAGILYKISGGEDCPVERDAVFQVIQKDINAFDIETEISPVDLRPYRLTFAADSKRNLLLLSRFMKAGLKTAEEAGTFIPENLKLLRTLPAFFNIQVYEGCPQACSICPWPLYGDESVIDRKGYMAAGDFEVLLDKIVSFAGDAVIDISLWGEISLHPEKTRLIEAVLSRPALSLVVETSGILWKDEELKTLAAAAAAAAPRKNHMAPLSWIVSLDSNNPDRYKYLRGAGFEEARSCAKNLLSLFPNDTYVQAVRVKGFEDDIEAFYRSWKSDTSRVIIQKYDDFAGTLEKLTASDLSPVKRRPCWHIQRDMNILLDGTVPCCREDLDVLKGGGSNAVWGNVFINGLSGIWEKGASLYSEHCDKEYRGICEVCDEYYTYNF